MERYDSALLGQIYEPNKADILELAAKRQQINWMYNVPAYAMYGIRDTDYGKILKEDGVNEPGIVDMDSNEANSIKGKKQY